MPGKAHQEGSVRATLLEEMEEEKKPRKRVGVGKEKWKQSGPDGNLETVLKVAPNAHKVRNRKEGHLCLSCPASWRLPLATIFPNHGGGGILSLEELG